MRYIGNKARLLSHIDDLITRKKLNQDHFTFCDPFSGTASVGELVKDRFRIIANDNQYYSYVLTQARLNTPDLRFSCLGLDPFELFNQEEIGEKGFIYQNYSLGGSERMYFSEENAQRIDYIRTKLEVWRNTEKVDDGEYYYLLACLLESVSKVSNVAGVYGAYLKTWDPRAVKTMKFIRLEQEANKKSLFEAEVHNKRAEELIFEISGDILYLDPPYTKNQYSVQYHLLETIAHYDAPEIKGKGGLRNTSETSSLFSRSGDVYVEFERIIAKAEFKYIILSYSSAGLMSSKFIEKVLKRYGKPETYELVKIPYKHYKNHHTPDQDDHSEYLFFIEKKDYHQALYASPLNYIGGKYDMVDFIRQYLPNQIERFVDMFGGGYNVGINIDAKQSIYNEFNHKVVELLETFRDKETSEIIRYVQKMQKRYDLSKNGKEAYVKLRDKYNSTELSKRDPRMLYLLILYGFNQQIRFNSNYDYNNPVGPAEFNDNILEKLVSFCRRLKEQNLILLSRDFIEMDEYIDQETFVYCDPPYLVTLGSYNDGKRGFNGWGEDEELRLLDYLDGLNKKGVKFMLSNVLSHNGTPNKLLAAWIKKNNYKVVVYSGKARKNRQEIIVMNYDKDIKK